MQFPQSIRSFTLPNTAWRYSSHLRAQRERPVARSGPQRPASLNPVPSNRHRSYPLKGIGPTQVKPRSNCNRSSQYKNSHSTPPPITANDTPRSFDVEAGLKAIESDKQREDRRAKLRVGSTPTRPRCNSYSSSIGIVVNEPSMSGIDEAFGVSHVIRTESLLEGPINITELHAEGPRGHPNGEATRGRSR